jgi:beta-glucosidase
MSRIDIMLASMTLEEKLGQLNMATGNHAVTGPELASDLAEGVRSGRVGSILNLWGSERIAALQKVAVEQSRLGIPLLVGFDVLHGHRTLFPIPLAEASAFDPQLWEQTAHAAAVEACQDGIALTFAPMLDIARDPRWGRIAEGAGEDALVASSFAAAKVRGFQGESLADAGSVAATAKHFCGYGAAFGGLDYGPVDVSDRLLHEVYLPPFAAALRSGCVAVMPAFNSISGVPMTMHAHLLRSWLRENHGFDGVVVSDYGAIAELVQHRVAADLAEAAALALRAGVDIDMVSDAYLDGLPVALARRLVKIEAIDAAVRRVLELKQRLGLFENPRRSDRAETPGAAFARRELAREAARRSIVLLTNDGVLPLAADLRRIALVGPLADAAAEMRGPWHAAGDPTDPVGFRAGLAAALPGCAFVCVEAAEIAGDDLSGLPAALDACGDAELVILCLGEAAEMSGEAACRADLGLPGRQDDLARAVLGLGKPTIVLVSCGRPLTIGSIVDHADAVLVTWFLGAEAGNAVADVITGRFDAVGRLPVTWPRHVGQVPIFYASRPSGRPADPDEKYSSKYLDVATEPQFWFGHGLSYTRFTLAGLRTDRPTIRPGETLTVAVDVTNAGPRSGEATIFLFARDLVASVARPDRELVGFSRIALAPGETGTLSFALEAAALCCLGPDLVPCLEPGDFLLSAGQSADPERHLSIPLRAVEDRGAHMPLDQSTPPLVIVAPAPGPGFARAAGEILPTVIATDPAGLVATDAEIATGDRAMPVYFARPDAAGPFPIVLVVHEIFGLHEHIRDVVRRLAKLGYLAVAPELFFRAGDPSTPADIPSLLRDIVGKVRDREVMQDLDAALTFAGRNGGDARRAAITGFCWGGRITWLYAAHNPELRAGVAWYGRLDGDRNERTAEFPIDVAARLKVPVLGLYGGADQGIPVASVERMRGELASGPSASEILVYPDAPHAFFADYRPSYRETAAREAWSRLCAWLAAHGLPESPVPPPEPKP